MYAVIVNISVKPEHTADFIAATRENHVATRKEPQNVRFDLAQRTDDPNRFVLYEVYREAEGFAEHQKTAHYLTWKEAVAPWMAEPRSAQKCTSLFPEPWL